MKKAYVVVLLLLCFALLSAISFFIFKTDAFSNKSDQPASDSNKYQCADGTVPQKLDNCRKQY